MAHRAFIFALLLAAFLLPIAFCAQNDSDIPPLPPQEGGPVLARAIFSDGSMVKNAAIVILIRSNTTDTVLRTMTDSNGRFLLPLPQGGRDIDAILDLPGTPGVDYASTTSSQSYAGSNATMIFYPSGSLSGRVQQGGSPLPLAHVRVFCPSNTFDYARINGFTEAEAGQAGEFMFRALPAGTCTVSAYTSDEANSAEAEINAGQTSLVSIDLRPKASNSIVPIDIVVGICAIAAVIIIYLALNRKSAHSPPQAKSEFSSAKKSVKKAIGKSSHKSRQSDGMPQASDSPATKDFAATSSNYSQQKISAILSTLSDREAEILKAIISSNGRAKAGHLAHKLLIPKTSVRRNLRSLERKNIVTLEPFGRNLLVRLKEEIFQ